MKYVLIITAVLLAGCTGPFSNTSEQASEQAKAAAKMQGTIVSPAPVLGNGNTFSGNVTIGKVPILEKTVDSEISSDLMSSYSMETKVSFAFACFFFALSLGIGAVGLWLLIQVLSKSKAIRATSTLLDSGIASAVNMATSHTDPGKIADANNTRAILEGLRKHI
jgi:hypothetical protein